MSRVFWLKHFQLYNRCRKLTIKICTPQGCAWNYTPFAHSTSRLCCWGAITVLMEQFVKLNACLRNSIQLAVVHFRISTWHAAVHQLELESFANWIHTHLSWIKHTRHNTLTCFTSQITLKQMISNNMPWHFMSIFLCPIYSHEQMKVTSLIYNKYKCQTP